MALSPQRLKELEEQGKLSFSSIDREKLDQELMNASSFEQQVRLLLNTLLLTSNELDNRKEFAQLLEEILNEAGIVGSFHLFGSSANSIGFKNADIDLYFAMSTFEGLDASEDEANRERVFDQLSKIRSVLMTAFDMKVYKPQKARIPIIKLDFKIERNVLNGLNCDISLTSAHGPCHAKLLSYLSSLEPLFLQLTVINKYWMKKVDFLSPHRLASFAMVLLVMFYCQQEQLLPAIKDLNVRTGRTSDVYEFDPIKNFEGRRDKPSLAKLFLGFFDFYNNFDFRSKVVAPFHGHEITVSSCHHLHESYRRPGRVCVQDVFDMSRNQAHGMTEKFTVEFMAALKHAVNSIRELRTRFGSDDERVAFEQFKKLLATSAILSAKQKSKQKPHPVSLAAIAEYRRPQVLMDWSKKFPELTHLVLTKLIGFECIKFDKKPFLPSDDFQRRKTVAYFGFMLNNSDWTRRKEVREVIKFRIMNLKFIDKEIAISHRIHPTPNCSTKLTFKLDMDPEPDNLLIQIKFIEVSGDDTRIGPDDQTLGAFLNSFLKTVFVKYFQGSDLEYQADMSRLRQL